MIRSVAAWGIEVGWRGQGEWRVAMVKLQYAALRKCTGAVVGARKKYVRKVAAVERVEMFARASAGRFLVSMHDMRPAACGNCGARGPCANREGGSVTWRPMLAGCGDHCGP